MSGSFRTRFVGEQLREKPPLWCLRRKLIYETAAGVVWTVSAGFLTDLASVPRMPLAYLVAGGVGNAAAVLHDYFYQTHVIPRAEADALFLEALESLGVSWSRRWAMYLAVRAAGQHAWDSHVERTAQMRTIRIALAEQGLCEPPTDVA